MSNLLRLVACLFFLLSFNAFAVEAGFPYTEQKVIYADTYQKSEGGFGDIVAIDNDTAVIGSFMDQFGRGSVYVFKKINGSWIQQQKLMASDKSNNDNFGYSVAISGDRIIVGSYRDDDMGQDSGSAYIYTAINGIWSQTTKLTANDGSSFQEFGRSVAIDGDTVVIGTPRDINNPLPYASAGSGSAYVFTYNNGSWLQQQKLTLSNSQNNSNFAEKKIAIDGDNILIGSSFYDTTGAAFIFNRLNDGNWHEIQKLVASDLASNSWAGFGKSVSLDGNIAVVGAPNAGKGKVYIFNLNNDVWLENQILTSSDEDSDKFGYDVSIKDKVLAVGAWRDTSNGPDSGSAFIYTELNAGWIQDQKIIPSDSKANMNFGMSLSVDNSFVLIGAPADDIHGSWSGSSYFYNLPADPEMLDSDGDGAYDHQDNCPSVSNADQANLDGDTFGDACDNDKDGDGFTSDFDLNDLNTYFSTDPDGDGVDSSGESHYTNNVCLRAPNCNENDPCVTVCYVPPQDNCPTVSNSDQNDLDNDNLGNVCDPDKDGDGLTTNIEDRHGGTDWDQNDFSLVVSNIENHILNSPTDSDLDGVPDDYETAAGGDTTSSTFESVLAMLTVNKNVPAMGGIGLLALGLSMLGLGAVRLRKK